MYTVMPTTNPSQEFTPQDPRAFARTPKPGLLVRKKGGLDQAVRGSRGKPQEGPPGRGGRGYGPSAPSPFPTSFPAITWRGARGWNRAGARRRKEGVRVGKGRGLSGLGEALGAAA